MVNVYNAPTDRLIEEVARELEKMPEMAPPEWANFVKTGVNRERPPVNPKWWYVRSAAVLRSVYKLGPIGVSKLRTKYGGRKNRGYAPDKAFRAGGNILRKILQKLELVGFLKQTQVGVHKGRVITPKGKSFMDKIALGIKDAKPTAKKAPKETQEPKEAPAKKAKKAMPEVKGEQE